MSVSVRKPKRVARKRYADDASPRATLLSKLGPRGWYSDHVNQSTCHCVATMPDNTCDTGVALYQLRLKELPRKP